MTLTNREKIVLIAAALFIALFSIVEWGVFPHFEAKARLKRQVKSKSAVLAEMRQLKTEYLTIRQKLSVSRHQFENRDKTFRLFTFLEKLAGEAHVKENISYMKPTSKPVEGGEVMLSLVEMQLKKVGLNELVAYLYRIETSKNRVSVKRLSIVKSDRKEGMIDAVMQLEAIVPQTSDRT